MQSAKVLGIEFVEDSVSQLPSFSRSRDRLASSFSLKLNRSATMAGENSKSFSFHAGTTAIIPEFMSTCIASGWLGFTGRPVDPHTGVQLVI